MRVLRVDRVHWVSTGFFLLGSLLAEEDLGDAPPLRRCQCGGCDVLDQELSQLWTEIA